MGADTTDNQGLWPDDDDVIFVPDELYYGIHRRLAEGDELLDEMRKFGDAMTRSDNMTPV
jgi:hypothetical protein